MNTGITKIVHVKVCQPSNKSLRAQGAHTVKGAATALCLLFARPIYWYKYVPHSIQCITQLRKLSVTSAVGFNFLVEQQSNTSC